MRRSFPSAVILTGFALAGWLAPPGASQAQAAPAAAPATFLGDAACADCHEEVVTSMRQQVHGRLREFETAGHGVGCESCHGAGSAHVEADGDPALIRRFGDGDAATACIDCHRSQGMGRFQASVHAANGLSCQDCHSIHKTQRPSETCRDCHGEVAAELELPSHHPVREGMMTCSSCHDVHGLGVALLKGDAIRVNDACYDCHQEKEGPFVFEHEPAGESCSTCHRAHGSVANNLLTLSQPALCLQCHELHFHAGYQSPTETHVEVGGIPRENPWGARGMNIAFTANCTQCHPAVHGTDTPSQAVSGFGGLTQ
jgi:DmsE family decaheme c-type cytochrome